MTNFGEILRNNLPPRFNTTEWLSVRQDFGGVEACEFMVASVAPRGHGVHHYMVRNVVEMMMKRTVSYSFYVFVVRSKCLLDSHFLFVAIVAVRTFTWNLQEPIAHAKYDSRRGSRNTRFGMLG
jgi:hypothetical protein